jgi:hypothetical protein
MLVQSYIIHCRTSFLRLRCRIAQSSTILTGPRLLIRLESFHPRLNLGSQIRTMKRCLMHLLPTLLAIPPQSIKTGLGPRLLHDYSHSIREPYWVMRRVRWQQKHIALVYVDIAERPVIDNFEQHAAFVLVEPFGRLVDVVVGSRVGSADYHYCEGVVVDAVVVHGGLEEVGVFGDPGRGFVSLYSRRR